ncbi:MAG TPA: DUF3795 domain-containing protein [Bacteroidales bacterium]
MIAYCGLTCSTCPIYLATLEEDKAKQQTMRASIARLCTETYGMILQPGDINDCDGCIADTGRLFSGCAKCEIRECASQRSIMNCAYCEEYACARLTESFDHEPGARETLEKIRNTFS